MTQNTTKKSAISVEKLTREIEKYFDGVTHSCKPERVGENILLTITYYDFKPRRQVRNDIENLAPNVEVESIERQYSNDALLYSFRNLSDSDKRIYVMQEDGELQQTSIDALLCNNLAHRSLTDEELRSVV